MSKDRPSTPITRPAVPSEQRGYQPRPITEGYNPKPQSGHQPTTGHNPPSNPPNQGSGGKK